MMSSRKRVMAKLARLEKDLHHHEAKLKEHKHYLVNLIGDKRIVLITTLLPAFIMGWSAARAGGGQSTVKKFLKFVVLATVSNLKLPKK